jgi:hypothetical protein
MFLEVAIPSGHHGAAFILRQRSAALVWAESIMKKMPCEAVVGCPCWA